NLTATPNQPLSFAATASDVDADQTLSFDLVDAPGGAAIDPSSGAFTWTPTNVQGNQTYTFEVRVSDNGSPPLADAVPVTVSVGASQYSVWSNQVVPAVPAANDPSAVEVGVKFQTDVAGTITGIRFYKGPGNTGTHVGNLWDDQGHPLATAAFTNETDTGWQQVNFATPVPIQAHTTYVASYFAPNGEYAVQTNAFAAAGIDAAPIHLLQDGTNGVFQYSPVSTFPGNTFSSANYYVDVVFCTSSDVFEQTTAADFATGTLDGVQVNDASGGELSLAQGFDDFTGTSLGSNWTSSSWASLNGGQTPEVDVSGGILSVAGVQVLSSNSTGANPVEGSVNFPAAPFEHFGLATGFDNPSTNAWAIFSTLNTTDTLFARVNNFGVEQVVNLGPLPNGFHDYRVQPVAGGFQFSVDGVMVTTIAANIPSDVLKAAAISGFNGSPTPPLQIDWIRLGDYVSTGTYTSKVFDAGQVVNWGQISWTASIPAGSSITVEVSTGDTAAPDASWSDWTAVTDGSQLNNLTSRYIRYRIIINSTDPLSS